MNFYSHSHDSLPEVQWERLEDHLADVAELAQNFAAAFEAESWGRAAGLWHDVGKYRPEFQARIRGSNEFAPHASTGALLAQERGVLTQQRGGAAVAFAIAGHHTGLANLNEVGHGPTPLKAAVRQAAAEFGGVPVAVPKNVLNIDLASPPWFEEDDSLALEFLTRMLFSCLVDADRLQTGRWYANVEHCVPTPSREMSIGLDELRDRLDTHLDSLAEAAAADGETDVYRFRQRVLKDCRNASGAPAGLFSLTVPTGGGKTLAAMSFALRHACERDLRRVIVVIPFTSIIEQSAGVYREAFGEDDADPSTWSVLEHHSGVDELKRFEEAPLRERLRDLAAENWDAPIVVTTTVQFFESLFTSNPSRSRKLHRIANSVVTLDEVQTLPPQFLRTITDGLSQLSKNYGCSIVLSTATPPALEKMTPAAKWGLTNVRPIVNGNKLAKLPGVRRVMTEWRVDDITRWPELADEIAALDQCLVIVPMRKDAQTLFSLLPNDEANIHLSALMCPQHRSDVLQRVRDRLSNGEPCRLIATSLIEAGVDVDFPVVYRALAGVDSLAQAAGRCDREGKRTAAAGEPAGRLIVFRAESKLRGLMKKSADATTTLLNASGGALDLFCPGTATRYFERLYNNENTDAFDLQRERQSLNFANVDRDFRLIDNGGACTIVVPYDEVAAKRIESLQGDLEAGRGLAATRALQPYVVQVNRHYFEEVVSLGRVEAVTDQLGLPTGFFAGLYGDALGLKATPDSLTDPEANIV